MKTSLKFNSLATENAFISLKTGFLLAMVAGFMYITYLGMSKPNSLRTEKERMSVTTSALNNLVIANI